MNDIKNNSSFREENTELLPKDEAVTQNVRASLENPTDPEKLIAQQIESAVGYKTPENARIVLKNIEDNLNYNKNKAAIIFYLAYAYEKLNDTQKAVILYQTLRKNYMNGRLSLYLFNSPRTFVEDRIYSVYLHEETLLRQSKIDNPSTHLSTLLNSSAGFGFPGQEQFLYANLAKLNLIKLAQSNPLIMSYEQYYRLFFARKILNDFLAAAYQRNNLELVNQYINEDFLAKKAELIQLVWDKDSSVFKNMVFNRSRTSGVLFYYLFTTQDKSLTIELVDDGSRVLVNDIIASTSGAAQAPSENKK